LNFVETGVICVDGNPNDNFIVLTGNVTNSSGATMTVLWERDELDMATGWASQICDVNLCFLEWIGSQSFDINAGETLPLRAYFKPYGNVGCSKLKLSLNDQANPDNFDELIYHGTAGGIDCPGFVECFFIAGVGDWYNPNNWSCNAIPDQYCNVVIPDFSVCNVVPGSTAVCNTICVEEFAEFNLDNPSVLDAFGN